MKPVEDVLEQAQSAADEFEAQLDKVEAILEADPAKMRRDYEALINGAFQLQRQAGRAEQARRAKDNPPPRKILRALGSMQKKGRRGRKARARIQREIIRKVGDVKL